ncbi:MAG: cytochrome b/b6 domain-containing protein [Deltaproteobacteria bacterium]|nr:cytochrome b/b6 domain-containing protein [Deltaproteobacteria bacterium]
MKRDGIGRKDELDVVTRILHLGLVFFGLLALATGNFAGDYKIVGGIGFSLHRWIGVGVALLIGLRLAYGIWGPEEIRFINWVPYTRERLRLVWEDVAGLARFRLPERQPHQGVAALVETSGLLLFLFLAASGLLLFFMIAQGHRAEGMTRAVKEFHEVAEVLLPLFFFGHGGAVLLHAMTGNHLWRKMVFLKNDGK